MADHRDTLVLGSSGIVGRRVVSHLHALGIEPRLGSRSGTPRFEWADPGSWGAVLDGVTRLFLLSPEGVAVHPDFVDAATTAGVRRVVLLSDRGAEVMRVQRLLDAEAMVRASDLEWTVLRPDWFDQDFDESFFQPGIVAGLVTVPIGDVRQGFVDAEDIGAVAARCLLDEGHTGATYDLTGPEALTFDEALATIGTAAGRDVRFEGDPASYRTGREALDVDEAVIARELEDFARLAARGDAVPSDAVERVTGRPATSFATYAARAAASGAWSG